MPSAKRGWRSRSTALWLCAVVLSFAAGGFLGSRFRPGPPATATAGEEAREEPAPDSSASRRPEPAPGATSPPVIPRGEGARIAVVIDDLGRSVREVQALAQLPVPVTYSVLPFEHSTGKVVAAVREVGGQLLCHLPMEPANGANPGPGALHAAMSRRELTRATGLALDAVAGAVGANHHMGSLLSADERSMRIVLGVLAGRGLFYLDSKTSTDSVGYRVGRDLGVPSLERQVFLDPDRNPQAIREQFHRLLLIAVERRTAVAIGHPYPETLEVLRLELPRALAAGFEFVEVSALAGV